MLAASAAENSKGGPCMKEYRIRKVLALLLCCVMLAGLLPTTALAAAVAHKEITEIEMSGMVAPQIGENAREWHYSRVTVGGTGYVTGSGNAPQEEVSKPDAEEISGTEEIPDGNTPDNQPPLPEKRENIHWAMAVMIGLVSFGVAITATVIVLKMRKK